MIEETLDITTKDGAMETFVCRPERGGPFAAVCVLMDAPGIREELRDMARRLSTVGTRTNQPTTAANGQPNCLATASPVKMSGGSLSPTIDRAIQGAKKSAIPQAAKPTRRPRLRPR